MPRLAIVALVAFFTFAARGDGIPWFDEVTRAAPPDGSSATLGHGVTAWTVDVIFSVDPNDYWLDGALCGRSLADGVTIHYTLDPNTGDPLLTLPGLADDNRFGTFANLPRPQFSRARFQGLAAAASVSGGAGIGGCGYQFPDSDPDLVSMSWFGFPPEDPEFTLDEGAIARLTIDTSAADLPGERIYFSDAGPLGRDDTQIAIVDAGIITGEVRNRFIEAQGGFYLDARACPSPGCGRGDLDRDCDVDGDDLTTLLANFGLASGAERALGDTDSDGDVDLADLANLVTEFDHTCDGSPHEFVVEPARLAIAEGFAASFSIALQSDPGTPVDVFVQQSSGSAGIELTSPNVLTFTPQSFSTAQAVAIAANEDENRRDDHATIRISGEGFVPIYVDVSETDNDRFVLDRTSLVVTEGGEDSFTVALSGPPTEMVEVQVHRRDGDEDLSVRNGAALLFTPEDFAPRTVVIAAAEDEDLAEGAAEFVVSAAVFGNVTVTARERENDTQPTIFVDAAAAGSSTGRTWSDAFADLSAALTLMQQRTDIHEVRVAGGVYTPAPPNGPRDLSFQLPRDTALGGGYAGAADPGDPGAHDPNRYPTILSGDLNGDDSTCISDVNFDGEADSDDLAIIVSAFSKCRGELGFIFAADLNRDGCIDLADIAVWFHNADQCAGQDAENSFRVLTTTGGGVVIEDVVIQGGRSNEVGGGARLIGRAIVRGCTFRDNRSTDDGGGLYTASIVTLMDCLFENNRGKHGGGAALRSGSTLVGCEFVGNTARMSGGGVDMRNRELRAVDCRFRGNAALSSRTVRAIGGGALYTQNASLEIVQCEFDFNRSNARGGGVSIFDARPAHFARCTFAENTSEKGGGALVARFGSSQIEDSVFLTNVAGDVGGAVVMPNVTEGRIDNCTFYQNRSSAEGGSVNVNDQTDLFNCILWAAFPDEVAGASSVSYCDVAGGWPGPGNINIDPAFVDPLSDNLRLTAGSPCVDAGDPAARPLFGRLDFDGRYRLWNGRVDMGAFEFGSLDRLVGDLNVDCSVDTIDLGILLASFGRSDGVTAMDGDLDGDRQIGLSDLGLLLSNVGAGCP